MKRNKFNLSHYKLLTFDQGELVPCGLIEVLPGDTFQQASSALVRVSPLIAPVMHPVQVRIHHWFVPHRLVWNEWEDFITGGPDGFNSSSVPQVQLTGQTIGSLADYFGLPVTSGQQMNVSALPFRAYALVWNENYRDQDLQNELVISKASGVDNTTSTALQNVGWEKDYFTSARPWTQKGPEVTLPVQGDAPVIGIGTSSGATGVVANNVRESDGTIRNYANAGNPNTGTWSIELQGTAPNTFPNMRVDLSNVSATSINDLRLAFALQRYEEARARYGSRYTEYLRYLGVRSSDARLQRPEYLGGGKQTIQFSEVLQTSPSETPSAPVGALKGHGISAIRSNRYRKFFEEHGYIITMISVKPRTMYMQGIPRTWSRTTKEDYWQRELEHIGQQEILNKEVFHATGATNNGTFGFQDRYDEYRRQESQICGEFRDTTLDYWHMARKFSALPVLNDSFVKSNPTKRIYAEQTKDSLWVMVNHRVTARRQLSATGTSYIF